LLDALGLIDFELFFCPQLMQPLAEYFDVIRILQVKEVNVFERGLSGYLRSAQRGSQFPEVARVYHEEALVEGVVLLHTIPA
jgi:hypothetical protein